MQSLILWFQYDIFDMSQNFQENIEVRIYI